MYGELASYGFVVISIEHRDGSGPRTFLNLPKDEDVDNGKVDLGEEGGKNGFSRMDHVFPKDNACDTMPGNKQGIDVELHSAQIQLRLAEIEETYHVMTLIHNGGERKLQRQTCAGRGMALSDGAQGG